MADLISSRDLNDPIEIHQFLLNSNRKKKNTDSSATLSQTGCITLLTTRGPSHVVMAKSLLIGAH